MSRKGPRGCDSSHSQRTIGKPRCCGHRGDTRLASGACRPKAAARRRGGTALPSDPFHGPSVSPEVDPVSEDRQRPEPDHPVHRTRSSGLRWVPPPARLARCRARNLYPAKPVQRKGFRQDLLVSSACRVNTPVVRVLGPAARYGGSSRGRRRSRIRHGSVTDTPSEVHRVDVGASHTGQASEPLPGMSRKGLVPCPGSSLSSERRSPAGPRTRSGPLSLHHDVLTTIATRRLGETEPWTGHRCVSGDSTAVALRTLARSRPRPRRRPPE
jgi:hypothetical protein